uniref:Protein sleepless n=2 Tax=Dendroctonus ponderosae TaxID=77166 RepID=A0AAR5PGS6_DENPD
MLSKFFVLVIILFQMVGTGFSLQCYNCSGQKGTNNDCEVNLANVKVEYCMSNELCGIYISQTDDIVTIKRSCMSPYECELVHPTNAKTGETSVISYRLCNSTSLCNSASTLKLKPHLLFFGSIAISVMISNVLLKNLNHIVN